MADELVSPDEVVQCKCCGQMRATLRDCDLGPVCGGCYGQLVLVSLEMELLGMTFQAKNSTNQP